MKHDKFVEQLEDGLCYNKLCKGCKGNCISCIGFSLSCIIDNVIAVAEHKSKELLYDFKEYQNVKRYFFIRKRKNNGSLWVDESEFDTVKMTCDLFNAVYSKYPIEDIKKIKVDVTQEYFNAKKNGRVEIDGFKLPKNLGNYIKRNIKADNKYDVMLIGVIVNCFGLHGLMIKGAFYQDKSIVALVRSMAMVNDCLLFNWYEDKSKEFHPIHFDNTVVFSKEQVDKAMFLDGYKDE